MQGNLDDFMSRIYGSKATQMVGGAKLEICDYPEYIKNKDFVKFMMSFYLVKRITHTPSSAVYIIPPSDELDKMIIDYHKQLKDKNIALDTDEAYKYAATENLPYKRCVFTVFGDGDSERYRLDANYKKFETLKRTNLANEVLYFKYEADDKIKICQKPGDTTGEVVNLIAKCKNGIYVFQGTIPEAKEKFVTNTSRKISKKNDGALTGGSDSKYQLKKTMLKDLMEGNEHGAERFVASMALMAYEMKDDDDMREIEEAFSGDLVHSAFKIVFNNKINNIPPIEYEESDIKTMTKKMINKYKPSGKKLSDISKLTKGLKNEYRKIVAMNLEPSESTKRYKIFLKDLYKNLGINMLKADIATAMFRNGYDGDLEPIFNLVEKIDSEESLSSMEKISKLEFSNKDNTTWKTSRFNYIINKNILSAPIIGQNAKTYFPIITSYHQRKRIFNAEVDKDADKDADAKKKISDKIIDDDEEVDIADYIY